MTREYDAGLLKQSATVVEAQTNKAPLSTPAVVNEDQRRESSSLRESTVKSEIEPWQVKYFTLPN